MMKFPLSTNGTTTVNELIAALLEFPPNAEISMTANYMQDCSLQAQNSDGMWDTVLAG